MASKLESEYDEFVAWKREKHAERVARAQFKPEFVPLIDEEARWVPRH